MPTAVHIVDKLSKLSDIQLTSLLTGEPLFYLGGNLWGNNQNIAFTTDGSAVFQGTSGITCTNGAGNFGTNLVTVGSLNLNGTTRSSWPLTLRRKL